MNYFVFKVFVVALIMEWIAVIMMTMNISTVMMNIMIIQMKKVKMSS